MLHYAYSDFRGRGEWFSLPTQMLDTMAYVAARKRPSVRLLTEWPVARVWRAANVADGSLSPLELASIFAAFPEKPPTDRPRRLLAVTQ